MGKLQANPVPLILASVECAGRQDEEKVLAAIYHVKELAIEVTAPQAVSIKEDAISSLSQHIPQMLGRLCTAISTIADKDVVFCLIWSAHEHLRRQGVIAG
jgi:hypothetical protein